MIKFNDIIEKSIAIYCDTEEKSNIFYKNVKM